MLDLALARARLEIARSKVGEASLRTFVPHSLVTEVFPNLLTLDIGSKLVPKHHDTP